MKKYSSFFILFFLLIPHTVLADVICLKFGNKIEGVIEKETDDAVTIVLSIGSLTYPKAQIESISKSGDEENAKLKEKWKLQKQQQEAKREEQRRFAAEQEAKGLILYKGQWVTKDEYEKLTKPEIEDEKDKKVRYVFEPNIELPPRQKKSPSEGMQHEELLGKVTLMKLKSNPEQTYYLYLPKDYTSSKQWPLFIGIHGINADGNQAIDLWKEFADPEGFILACPSFKNGYQRLEYATDYRMIDIIGELKKDFRIDGKKIFIEGFSGGAQFTHRFVFRHTECVQAASIIAAGSYDNPAYSGKAKGIKFLVMVGEDDFGRLDATKKFAEQLKEKGYKVKFKSFPGVGHEVCGEAKKFTIDLFREMRDEENR